MLEFAGLYLNRIDAGDPLVVLAGVHVGCFEIFGGEQVRTLRDLKGKRIAVLGEGVPEHIFLSSVIAHVGLDPRRDVRWEAHPPETSMRLLAEGRIDAFAGFPPIPQELRDRGIGRLILNTSTDRPWSQYFCCMLGANRGFVRKNPVATKAVLKAILKAADNCQADPDAAAHYIVGRGYTGSPDYARQAMREIPYARWREFDPADTIRYYALRLHEAGMIRRTPNRITAESADWRILEDVKRELKG
jgi:NitT/TauT family transport system substrate-binding protein